MLQQNIHVLTNDERATGEKAGKVFEGWHPRSTRHLYVRVPLTGKLQHKATKLRIASSSFRRGTSQTLVNLGDEV